MAASFDVKFLINRTSPLHQLQLTDTSTGFTLSKAVFKITYPNGFVANNTDLSSPDISSAGGTTNKDVKFDVNNLLIRGDYVIVMTAEDNSGNTHTAQRSFNLTWKEPTLDISNTSDVTTPEVKFKDNTTGYDNGNFTETITTRTLSSGFPSTSAVSGASAVSGSGTSNFNDLEINVVNSNNYYEGVYTPSLSVNITYAHTNGFLSVQYINAITESISIKRAPTQTELLTKINQYKDSINVYKSTNRETFDRLSEQYDLVIGLYSHLIDRVDATLTDGSEPILRELLEIVEPNASHTFQSTPITQFTTTDTESTQDIVGTMVSTNTENGIAVTYDDSTGKLNFDVADFTITQSGDTSGSVTVTNLASATLNSTLATVNSNVGSFGSTTAIPVITVNAKGLITGVTTAAISTVLTLAVDGGGNDNITIGTDTLTISGGTGLTTSISDNNISVAIDSTVATLTGSQTLTNKTIDADNNTVSNIEVDNLKSGVLDTDLSSVAGTDTTLASAKAIKSYVDSQILTKDNTDEITEGSSNLYFTNERVDDRVNALITAGTGITSTYDDAAGTLTLATTITQYTDALARGAISVSGNALSYNSSTGVITSNFEEAPTFTGTVTADGLDLVDGKLIRLGNNNELRIQHASGISQISNYGGELRFSQFVDDGDITFYNDDGSGGSTEYFRVDGDATNVLFSRKAKFSDNVEAVFGDGADLKIYHDGSNSYITDTGTGNLIVSGSARVELKSANDKYFFRGVVNSGVDLYFNDSIKLTTTTGGIDVTGNIVVSGTVDGIDIAARDAVLTSTTTTANAALPKAGGTMTGDITLGTDADILKSGTNPFRIFTNGTLGLSISASQNATFPNNVTATTFNGDLNGTINTATTATTQSASDNSTKVATTAYVDTAVTNLVDSSPAALDTLNELAAALGDDANFSTTVTNSIATKVAKAGDTMTGALTVNLSSEGTYFTGGSGGVRQLSITSGTNTSAHALHTFNIASTNGKYEFEINSTPQLTLDSSSATFAGAVTVEGGILHLGKADTASGHINAKELMTFNIDTDNDDTNRYFGFYVNGESGSGTELVRIEEDGKVGIGTNNPLNTLHVSTSDDVTTLFQSTDSISRIEFADNNTTGSTRPSIGASGNNTIFTQGTTERMRIDSSGNVGIGTNSPQEDLHVYDTGTARIEVEGTTGPAAFKATNNQGSFGWYVPSDANNFRLFNFGTNADLVTVDASGNTTFAGDVTVNGGDVNVTKQNDAPIFVLTHDGTNPGTSDNLWQIMSWVDYNGTHENWGNITHRTTSASNTRTELLFDVKSQSGNVLNALTLRGGSGTPTATFAGDVTVLDNKAVMFGTGGDAFFKHTGSAFNFFNDVGNVTFTQRVDDGDIIFQSDDGSGGVATYFYLDGSGTRTIFEKLTRHNDGIYAAFGTDSDLRIYHDGNNSYIEQSTSATGNLIIQQKVDDGDIIFKSDDGSGGLATYFALDGGITRTVVYKNFNFQDDVKLEMGTGADLQIYHNGSNSYIDESGTGNLYLRTSESLYIQRVSNDDNIAQFTGGGGAHLYFNNNLKFSTTNTGISVTGDVIASGDVRVPDGEFLSAGDSNDLTITNTGVHALITNYTGNLTLQNLADDSDIIFKSDDGSGGSAEYFRLDGGDEINYFSKHIKVPDNIKIYAGSSQDLEIYHDGSHSYIQDAGTGELRLSANIFRVLNANSSETMIFAEQDGKVQLRFNESTKFETTSAGATVTGTLTATAFSGDGSNLTGVTGEWDGSLTGNATISGSLTAGSLATTGDTGTLSLSALTNVITMPSLQDNGTFLSITQTGNEQWLFKCESIGGGTADYVTIGASGAAGQFRVHEAGGISAHGNSDTVPAIEIHSDNTHGMRILHRATDGDFSFERRVSGTNTEFLRIGRSTGNATFAGTITSDDITIADGSNDVSLNLGNASYGLQLDYSAGDIFFRTNGATRLTIANDGAATFEGNLLAKNRLTVGQSTVNGAYGLYAAGSFGVGGNSTFAGTITTTSTATGAITLNGGTGVATTGAFVLRQNGDAAGNGIAITSSHATSHRIWKDASGNLNIGPSSDADAFKQDTSGNATFAGNVSLTGNLDVNAGEIQMDDGYSIQWGGNAILQHTGTETRIGDNSSSQAIVLTGTNATFAGNIEATGTRTISAHFDSQHFMRLESNSSGGVLKGTDGGVTTILARSYGDSYFNGGNFGIGTTSPATKLNVVDSTALTAQFSGYSHASSSNNARPASGSIRLGDGTGSTGLLIDYTDQGQTVALIKNEYVATTTSELRLQSPFISLYTGTSPSEKLRIDSSGNVGIGSNNPTYKLQVQGTFYVNETAYINGNTEVNAAFSQTGGAASSFSGDVTLESSTSTKPFLTVKNTNADANAPQFRLIKDSASPADNDETGRIYMYGDNDAGEQIESVLIRGMMTDVSDGSEDSSLEFFTYAAGSQGSASLKLESHNATFAGTVKGTTYLVNHTSASGIGASLGDINSAELGPGYLSLSRDDTAEAAQILFEKNDVEHTRLVTGTNFFAIDTATNIILDTDAGNVQFKDGGTTYAELENSSGNVILYSATQDKDILFKGNDGGSAITALTLDMSEGGNATFGGEVLVPSGDFISWGTSGHSAIEGSTVSNSLKLRTNNTVALTLDSSQNATFAGSVTVDALELDYNTSYYNQDKTISAYSASNYVYVNGTGGTDGLGLRLMSKGAATNVIGLENSNNSIFFNTNSTLALTINNSQNATFAGSVGIGAAPSEDLHITGDTPVIRLTDSDTSRHAQIVGIDGNLRFDADNDDAQSSTHIAFRTDGGEAMRIDASRNIGIGIDTPTLVAGKIVHIHGTAAGIHLTDTASGTANTDGGYVAFDNPNLYIQNKEAGFMVFETSAEERMRIESDGTVQITNSTSPKLQLKRGTKEYTSRVDNANKFVIQEEGGNEFFVVESGASSNSIRIDSSGNVGIGTTAPDQKLHIYHGTKDYTALKLENYLATANGAAYLNYQEIKFVGNASDGAPAGIRHYANLWQNGDSALAFWTSQHGGSYAERMRIDGDGNVGIGTTSPNRKLEVSSGGSDVPQIRAAYDANNYIDIKHDIINKVGGSSFTLQFDGSNALSFDSSENATFAGNVTLAGTKSLITNSILTASGDLDIKTVLTSRDIRMYDGNNKVAVRVKGDGTGTNFRNADTRFISLNYEDSINSIISHSGTSFGLESLNVRGDNIYFYTDYDASSPKGNITLTLDSSHNATFAGIVGMGSTGIYAGTNAQLNLPGRGIAIKNDKVGSDNNWSYIQNTGTSSQANLDLITGTGTAVTLNHDKSATFAGNINIGGTELAFTAADASFITAKESLILVIDSDNNQTSRVFQVKNNGTSGDVLFQINDDGTTTLGSGTVAGANAAADDFVITGPGTTATGMTISNTSDSGTGTIFFGDTSDSAAAGFRYNHNTGDMAISAEDNVTFTCDNVGIGETSPAGKLHVKTADAGSITTNSAHDDVIIEGSGNTGINIFSGTTSYQYLAFGDTGGANRGYVRYHHGDDQMVLRAGGTDTVYVNAGKVGIGTNTPDSKLEVITTGVNSVLELDNSDTDYTILQYNAQGVTKGVAGFNSTYMMFGGESGTDTHLQAGGQLGLTVKNDTRNVGIGTTSPSSKLHVQGGGLFTGSVSITADGQPALSVTGGISCGLDLVIAQDSQLQASRNTTTDSVAAAAVSLIDHNTGSGNRATMTMEANSYQGAKHIEFYQATTVNGSISSGLNATGFNTSSDYRLKEDLKDFNGLEIASKIKMYDFKWKSDDNARAYGVMAHELQEIFPQAVSGDKDEKSENGKAIYQGVDYSKLVPVLLKSIQELEQRIKELENK